MIVIWWLVWAISGFPALHVWNDWLVSLIIAIILL